MAIEDTVRTLAQRTLEKCESGVIAFGSGTVQEDRGLHRWYACTSLGVTSTHPQRICILRKCWQ